MLLDAENKFSDKQYITEECYSENVVYLGQGCEPAFGTPVPLLIQVVDYFDRLRSLTVTVQTSPSSDFSDNVADLVTATFPQNMLGTGATSQISFVPKGNRGYMRLKYSPEFITPDDSVEPILGHDGAITAAITTGIDGSWHSK